MVDAEVVERKVERAATYLDRVERLFAAQPPVPESDRDLASFYLLLAIQECVDLATHWIADAGWLAPDETAAVFDVLADNGAIDRGLAAAMRGAVGLRHRIAHGYATVDHQRVIDEAKTGLPSLRQFLSTVAAEAR